MDKVSAEKIDGLLIKSASTIRGLVQENRDLKAKLEALDLESEAEKIASYASTRGLIPDTAVGEYAVTLKTKTASELKHIQELLSHQAPGAPMGQLESEKNASVLTGSKFSEAELINHLFS